jgi:hypothetical protein
MDFRLKNLFFPKTYIWIDVLLLKETQKAILIEFNGKKVWLPKALIVKIKRVKDSYVIRIKISEYHWAMKCSL